MTKVLGTVVEELVDLHCGKCTCMLDMGACLAYAYILNKGHFAFPYANSNARMTSLVLEKTRAKIINQTQHIMKEIIQK